MTWSRTDQLVPLSVLAHMTGASFSWLPARLCTAHHVRPTVLTAMTGPFVRSTIFQWCPPSTVRTTAPGHMAGCLGGAGSKSEQGWGTNAARPVVALANEIAGMRALTALMVGAHVRPPSVVATSVVLERAPSSPAEHPAAPCTLSTASLASIATNWPGKPTPCHSGRRGAGVRSAQDGSRPSCRLDG